MYVLTNQGLIIWVLPKLKIRNQKILVKNPKIWFLNFAIIFAINFFLSLQALPLSVKLQEVISLTVRA